MAIGEYRPRLQIELCMYLYGVHVNGPSIDQTELMISLPSPNFNLITIIHHARSFLLRRTRVPGGTSQLGQDTLARHQTREISKAMFASSRSEWGNTGEYLFAVDS